MPQLTNLHSFNKGHVLKYVELFTMNTYSVLT